LAGEARRQGGAAGSQPPLQAAHAASGEKGGGRSAMHQQLFVCLVDDMED
jgi:hypothetical protein